MAFSRQFTWVRVDRDKTPETTKRYNVSNHPTLLFLNPEDEKIHRFSDFRAASGLLAEFFEAAGRWAQYRAGEEWDTKIPRAAEIVTARELHRTPVPFAGPSGGLVIYGDDLFVAERSRLHRIDAKTGEVKKSIALPDSIVDLTTDGELIYALESGWTAGKPIHVIDPETGRVARLIVTKENEANQAFGASGIAWREGRLWVLRGMKGRLHEIDPMTGEILRTLSSRAAWLSGLTWNGTTFVSGRRNGIVWLSPRDGSVVRTLPSNYPLRSVDVIGEDVLLMEQPIFGYDRLHRRIQVWPEKGFIYRVSGLREPAETDGNK